MAENGVVIYDTRAKQLRPLQRQCAAILASGVAAHALARDPKRYGLRRGVSLRTLDRWRELPAFQAMIDDETAALMERIRGATIDLVTRCVDISGQVGRGELDPDDSLARWAERQLSRTIYPVYVAQASLPPR